jgi:opacity protein-like surface antigen
MRQTMRDEVVTLGTRLSTLTATRWELAGRDRAVALTAGAKYLVGTGTIRPYVGAGGGIINLKRTVTEARIGDVTTAVFNDFNIGVSDLSLATRGLTRPMGEALVGVGIVAGSTYVDVGYRYRKAFRLTSGLDFSQLSVGIGYKF